MLKNDILTMPKFVEKNNNKKESYDNIQDVYKLENIKYKPSKIDIDRINEKDINNEPPILHLEDIGKKIWRPILNPIILLNLNQLLFNIMVPPAPRNNERSNHDNFFENDSPNSIQFIYNNFE